MDIVLRESERLNETIRLVSGLRAPAACRRARGSTCGRSSRTRPRCCATAPTSATTTPSTSTCPTEPVWYEADENQMRQIVWNLATNGLRAMPDGGRLLLSASQSDAGDAPDELVLAVEDEGCGIPAERARLASSSRSAARSSRGTGLGLAIVHRIVTDYGGTIQVSSTRRRGHDDARAPAAASMSVGRGARAEARRDAERDA